MALATHIAAERLPEPHAAVVERTLVLEVGEAW